MCIDHMQILCPFLKGTWPSWYFDPHSILDSVPCGYGGTAIGCFKTSGGKSVFLWLKSPNYFLCYSESKLRFLEPPTRCSSLCLPPLLSELAGNFLRALFLTAPLEPGPLLPWGLSLLAALPSSHLHRIPSGLAHLPPLAPMSLLGHLPGP